MRKILFGILIAFMFGMQSVIPALAAEDEIQQKETSVLQLVVMYTDESGEEHPVQGGTGFLIGNEESGAEYVVTAKEVTSVSKDTESILQKMYVSKDNSSQLTYSVRAVIKRDVMIEAQLVAESDEMGFAVWKLSQPLYDRQNLILCDEPLTGISGQKAVVLGFPTAPDLEGETIYYAMDEMISKNGMLIGDGSEENVKYLYHNITPNQGMIGGPLLNEEGDVIGINQSREAQEGYYALQMSELIPVLEALGVPYITTGDVKEKIQAELDAMVHKEELQKIINEAEAIDAKKFYKKSYEKLKLTLETGISVNSDENATQEDVNAAAEKISTALEELKERPPVWIVVSVVMVTGGVAAGLFVLFWKKTKTKREERKRQKIEETTVTQSAPVFAENNVQKEDYKKLVLQSKDNINNRNETGPLVSNEIYGETTVFQQDFEVSKDIKKSPASSHAYLIRKRTGEKIEISGKEVVLGKDPSQTDCCITGNSAISRVHAVIINTGTEYGVADKNATNGTFVNGVKVEPFQKVPLKNSDILRLSDEEFEFKVET